MGGRARPSFEVSKVTPSNMLLVASLATTFSLAPTGCYTHVSQRCTTVLCQAEYDQWKFRHGQDETPFSAKPAMDGNVAMGLPKPRPSKPRPTAAATSEPRRPKDLTANDAWQFRHGYGGSALAARAAIGGDVSMINVQTAPASAAPSPTTVAAGATSTVPMTDATPSVASTDLTSWEVAGKLRPSDLEAAPQAPAPTSPPSSLVAEVTAPAATKGVVEPVVMIGGTRGNAMDSRTYEAQASDFRHGSGGGPIGMSGDFRQR